MRVGTLEQRVDERCDSARLREHDQETEQHEHHDDWNQPVLLLLAEERPEFGEHATFAHGDLSTCVRNASDRDSASDTPTILGTCHDGASTDPCRSAARSSPAE